MNHDPLDKRLRELNQRRPLTESEQAELRAWLAAHPEAQADWEAEAALSEILSRRPDAPVPSNFTARVLREIEREQTAEQHGSANNWGWVWRVFMPRAGIAVVAVVALGVFIHQRNETAKRIEFVKNPAVITAVQSLPNVEVLEDFDVISSLGPVVADEELLALNSELQF